MYVKKSSIDCKIVVLGYFLIYISRKSQKSYDIQVQIVVKSNAKITARHFRA